MRNTFTSICLILLVGTSAYAGASNQVNSIRILHDSIAPGVPEVPGSRDSLPLMLDDDECVVACYRKVNNVIHVAGYYPTKGNYIRRICMPGGFTGDISPQSSQYSKQCLSVTNCTDGQCWAGGDTGGFYRIQH